MEIGNCLFPTLRQQKAKDGAPGKHFAHCYIKILDDSGNPIQTYGVLVTLAAATIRYQGRKIMADLKERIAMAR